MENIIHSKSYIIPAWDLKVDAKKEYRKLTQEALASRAFLEMGHGEINIRALTASDLGLKSWRTPGQPAENKSVWINHTLKDRQYIGIYGITQLSPYPRISGLRISIGHSGATTLGLHQIETLYSILPVLRKMQTLQEGNWLKDTFGNLENIRMEGYFAMPYMWCQLHVVYIEVDSFTNNKTGDHLVLNGFVAEPVGQTII